MKTILTLFKLMVISSCIIPMITQAQNPVVQTKYTADPAPMVYNDTVFLYTTHDEDDAQGFKMLDWLLYSSTDMVNWTDHGSIASLKSFKWVTRDNGAWAQQCVERNGKFYMYCPIHGQGIGVLVADSPYGPFKDPIDKPLVWQKEHWDDIDPTVFIDDDGQAYMYWGNPNVYYVKMEQIEPLNPYRRVEAETIAWGYGLKTEKMPDGRICVTHIDDNESLCVRGVDFGKGAKEFSIMAACNMDGGYIEIRLDSTTGPLIGTVDITRTGAMDRYKLMSCPIKDAKGIHDLYFCFKSTAQKNNLFFLDYWEFK